MDYEVNTLTAYLLAEANRGHCYHCVLRFELVASGQPKEVWVSTHNSELVLHVRFPRPADSLQVLRAWQRYRDAVQQVNILLSE
ncbi:MAG TPA: hypothetical protein EYP85_00915 [Armatimonadetes bacterium]|nr:hypothetical protein [Armatimonadota bacterium]